LGTPKSCSITLSNAEVLRKYVRDKAYQERMHPNTVWARLRKKYRFARYKDIDCLTFDQMNKELKLDDIYPLAENYSFP
jgi:hypothetical protein